MRERNTVKCFLPLVLFAALGLPLVLNGQQACGKSLHELQNWVYAGPAFRMPALPYPSIASGRVKTTTEAGLYPRYFLLEKPVPQALFCRLEHQLAQKIQLPVKFRLGSVQYVDWLEGKPGAYAY
ncbi:MAG: hypothetical protein R3D58_08300 [Saprospiraceae bacterium]|jgi:hypothetical protein|nr:hypothetical protein [Lewinellaceae bacterium]